MDMNTQQNFIKYHSLKIFVLILLLSTFSQTSYAFQCVDYDAVDNTPTFNFPNKSGFRFFWNRWLSRDIPFHMGHDVIVAENKSFNLVGKFDYGAVAHKDLEYEYVKVYYTGSGMSQWTYKGRYKTNSDGKINVGFNGLQAGNYKVRMVVVGDLSYADAWISVIKPNTQAIVFDIDETLTLSDLEQVEDYLGIEQATPRGGASDMVQAYKDLGYQIIYITARVYWYAKGTRRWLRSQNIPQWSLKTSFSNSTSLLHTTDYKRDYINAIKAEGIEVVRAYGNASTDIEAFLQAGIDPDEIYIIGDNAGNQGTQPIWEPDYYNHLAQVVYQTEESNCQ